ncbi:hypothetical protein NBO_69g0007 [Nosema bombycis CQ1]|uniref:Uncharacterized protein n=1 Tax=Nosema bombycis (strain CQ1 / CVCC 102059) TaxID=578461 RepID=R0ML30_NOSB1|nr:hypothetical protein NBO_69g0007 [Nosema bombycis CQ1]|eukprot:EOB13513.1 hypothetical protein NBO_69g0007 [Nosema bombycis CQ1]
MYSKLTDKEFVQKLRFVRPNKKYNQILMEEIVKRELCNDLYVINYINELQNLKLYNYEAQCLLLSKYDLSHRSSKFLKTQIEYHEIEGVSYNLKRVSNSIKKKKMTRDFEIFISALETILMSTKNKTLEEDASKIKAKINHLVIKDFLILVKKFKTTKIFKGDLILLKDFENGMFTYKESWFFVFSSKILSDYILFVFYFLCFENQKQLKYQILKKMIEDELDKEELGIFVEMETRFENYLNSDLFENFEEGNIEKNERKQEIESSVKGIKNEEKTVKSNDEIRDWYKKRVDSFTKSED